jgi:hypothetical protein
MEETLPTRNARRRIARKKKTCARCNIEKEFSDFYDVKGALDGKHSWCRPCCIDYNNNQFAKEK